MSLNAIPFKLPEPFALPDAWLGQFQGTTVHETAQFLAAFFISQDFADWVSMQTAELTPVAETPLPSGMPTAPELDAFARQAMQQASPLLIMGETQGQPLGFLYAIPLLVNGQSRGALLLRRPPQAGPLNHDQPAIVHALAEYLGSRL